MTLGDWIDGIKKEMAEDITREVTRDISGICRAGCGISREILERLALL